ncbi:hypothetical protein Cni_G02965 [Canna indica]|uniref:Uncharacterized protein n=1 Tax=Canna indica TaxID=4628 RepID=A0AAQ3JQB6_9LILI|nr:hypothetical protein Cni_G02965 [Canna indica]
MLDRQNLSGFLIGCVGTAVTLCAYSQTLVTSTQCVTAGLLILVFGLFVKEVLAEVYQLFIFLRLMVPQSCQVYASSLNRVGTADFLGLGFLLNVEPSP